VSVRGLSKSFGFNGSFKAVDNLGFDMFENQVFCLLGHNGAGKVIVSCWLRVLLML
jgi:ATP-binding cassette subfamily A (ABC1) protein 3